MIMRRGGRCQGPLRDRVSQRLRCAHGEAMVGFGFKQAWLAVRDGSAEAVTAALGLRDLGPVPWRHGIDLAYLTDDRVALTPPLPGTGGTQWLLVTGRWLATPQSPVDTAALSEALGTEIQFFLTHRVVELHRWERAVDGSSCARSSTSGRPAKSPTGADSPTTLRSPSAFRPSWTARPRCSYPRWT